MLNISLGKSSTNIPDCARLANILQVNDYFSICIVNMKNKCHDFLNVWKWKMIQQMHALGILYDFLKMISPLDLPFQSGKRTRILYG